MKRRPCGECPKFSNNYCKVFAKMVTPVAKSCNYGLKLMKNIYIAKWMANKRRSSK